MTADRLDRWAEEVDGSVFKERTERPSYVIPESWPTKRPPNKDQQWVKDQDREITKRSVLEALAVIALIALIWLAIWTWPLGLNHGLGDGGKGRDGNAAWVGEPASVVQPVAHRRRS